jgi:hypothetical protein
MRQWNLEKLNTYFLPMDSEVIQSIPISSRVQPDFWASHYERKGVFSVRSGYRMLACTKEKREAWLDEAAKSSNHGVTEASWTKLWQIRVPAKLRIFLWRLAKQSLPTADVLHHRNIAPASVCAICGAEDSWRHSLLDCTMARCVWALSDAELTEHMVQTQEPRARNWIFAMIDSLTHDQLTRMCVTAWAI